MTTASSVLLTLFVATTSLGQSSGPIATEEIENQNKTYQRRWNDKLVWRFDALPREGGVPAYRLPYSGFIYPDGIGGTHQPLQKYDRAFHRGTSRAADFERQDIAVHQRPVATQRPGGLFGRRMVTVTTIGTPYWHGHCNGWTAAAIRHAEPKHSVMRNGVKFSPADIKGLLAELYTYTPTDFLGGMEYSINPGTLHVVLANWLGRRKHPVAMEADPGPEKWNYPIYKYSSTAEKFAGGRQVEVTLDATFAMSTPSESDKAKPAAEVKHFHYVLNLDDQGRIAGGYYYRDSWRIDLLWLPLQPVPGGKAGNEQGNPHLDVKEVLSLWRESVDSDLRQKWVNIDPTPEDRVLVAKAKPKTKPSAKPTQPPRGGEQVAATPALSPRP